MQKNNLMKNFMAATMLLSLTMGMVSCQGLVDAIVGDAGQPAATTPTTTPTTPETKPEIKNVTLTIQGAQVNASTAAEVNTALAALAKDISEKGVGEGKEYTLEVTSDVFNAGDVENINVPEIEGATINVVIKNPFTKPTTLVFGKNTPSATRGDVETEETRVAFDEMFVTLPETEGENYPTIEFQRPNTKVVMKSANGNSAINVKDVTEISNFGFLEIGKGIIIDTYKWTPRSDEDFIRFASMQLIGSGNWIEQSQDAQEEGKMIVKNIEILPTEYTANLDNGANSYGKITVADGVKVRAIRNKGVTFKDNGAPKADVIESVGTSTVITGESVTDLYYNKAKGINFSTTATDATTRLNCSAGTLENCSTNYKQVVVNAPAQTAGQKSYDMTTFDGCEFGAGTLFGVYVQDFEVVDGQKVPLTFDNYEVTFTFKNCMIGDAALTASNLVISSDINPIPFLNDNITVYCVIDGTKYKVTWSKINGENCTLTPVA